MRQYQFIQIACLFFKNLYILYKLHIFSSKCLCDSLHRRQILHWRHSHFFFKLSGKILYRSIGQTCSNFCDVAIFFPHHFPCTSDLHSAEIFHWSASEFLMEKMLQRRPAHIKNITECIHIDLLLNMLLHIVDDLNQSGTFQMCCLFRQFKPFGIVRLFFPLPAQRQQKQLQIQQNHLLRAVGRILPKSYLLDPGNIDRCAECLSGSADYLHLQVRMERLHVASDRQQLHG